MDGDRTTADAAGGPGGATGTGGRPTARRGQALAAPIALAVLVVAGTALGAALLRPDGSAFAKGRGVFGASNAPVLLCAAAWLIGGIMLANQYRARLGYHLTRPALDLRLSDLVGAVLTAMAFVLPILLLALHRFSSGGSSTQQPLPPPSFEPPPSAPAVKPTPLARGTGSHLGFPRVLLTIALVLLVLAVVVAAVYLWGRLYRAPQKTYDATYATLDEQELLADAVESGRRALRDGDDARTAVIACYAAMEESLAASGVARRASDSPQDLLDRTVASGLLTGGHAADLTVLFREARYSTHPMDDGHRDRAAQALSGIAAQLAAARTAAEAAASADAVGNAAGEAGHTGAAPARAGR